MTDKKNFQKYLLHKYFTLMARIIIIAKFPHLEFLQLSTLLLLLLLSLFLLLLLLLLSLLLFLLLTLLLLLLSLLYRRNVLCILYEE